MCENLKKELDSLKKSKNFNDQTIEEYRKSLKDLEVNIANEREEKAAIIDQLKTLDSTNCKLEKEVEEGKKEVSVLKNKLKTFEAKKQDINSQLSIANLELKSVKDSINKNSGSIQELKDRMELECKPCSKKLSGPAPYQQHTESARHLIISSLGLSSAESSQQSIIASRPVNLYIPLKCDVCSILFECIVHFQSHCLTLQHANNVKAQHNATIDTNIENVYRSTFNGKGVKDRKVFPINYSDSILPSNSNCKAFDKRFSGHEPYQKHKRRVRKSQKQRMEWTRHRRISSRYIKHRKFSTIQSVK